MRRLLVFVVLAALVGAVCGLLVPKAATAPEGRMKRGMGPGLSELMPLLACDRRAYSALS
jgi:hypothetical protein